MLDWLVFGEGLGHACSIDFGSHKLATMPPNRLNDSKLMVTKVLGLTPLHPNHTPKVSTT